MYVLDRSVIVLLEAIRSSTLPSLADDIEAHLQAGRVPLFERKEDQSSELEQRRHSVLVAKNRGSTAPLEINPTDEELSTAYTPDEQIEESIRLVEERLQATVDITDDISRVKESLGLPAIDLIYSIGDTTDRLASQSQALDALHRWKDIVPQIRNWMLTERAAATPDAE